MHNVKISRYVDSTEIVVYDVPIFGHEKENSAMIMQNNNGEYIAVPLDFAMPDPKKSNKESNSKSDDIHSFFVSYNRTKNKIYNYARANKWEWFLTFTFNPKYVDSFSYEEVSKFMSDFLRWINDNTKRHGNPCKYLIVPEQHKSGRWHLHGIFSGLDMNLWKFSYSGHNTNKGQPIFNIGCFPYGWTTATMVQDSSRVSHYIVKYITKDVFTRIKNKKRYWVTRNASSGEHSVYFMSQSEIEILLDSIGEPQSVKNVDTPYNSIKYYQF
jgi:hypothetical protein